MESNCKGCEFRLKSLENKVEKGEASLISHGKEIEKTNINMQNTMKKLENVEKQTQAIYKLSTAVEQMTQKIQETIDYLKEHEERIDKLERAPNDTIALYFQKILWMVVSGSVGYYLSHILRGGF